MSERVIVAGGGIVGRTIAVALATQSHVAVTLLAGPTPPPDERASAVAAAARRMFSRLGIWQGVAEVAQPINDMVITDSRADDVIRPEVLTFEGERDAGAFAHMVPNDALRDALVARCADLQIDERPASAAFYEETPNTVDVDMDGGGHVSGAVLIAADGRQSKLRQIAGISVVERDYDQYGLAGTLSHAKPHHGRATQHFLPNGPFAMLPLAGDHSSIVWTERPAFARSLAETDPMLASIEIERVFGLSLGRLCVEPPLRAHPLKAMLARTFFEGRVALAGDAAHVIHPLAGQGLNLGLRDAAALAETLVLAARHGEDLSLALP
ncbi:MAG: FAD-dependent monooxygenase, partial [Pseudomonadota bacterium]